MRTSPEFRATPNPLRQLDPRLSRLNRSRNVGTGVIADGRGACAEEGAALAGLTSGFAPEFAESLSGSASSCGDALRAVGVTCPPAVPESSSLFFASFATASTYCIAGSMLVSLCGIQLIS